MKYKIYYQKNNKLRTIILEASGYDELRELAEFPKNIIKITPKKTFNQDFKILLNKQRTVLELFKQLQTMLDANLTLNESINLLLKTEKNPIIHTILSDINYALKNSLPLSRVLKKHSRYINATSVLFLDLGIKNGNIKQAVASLVAILQNSYSTRQQLQETFRYPIILISTLFIAVSLMLAYVLPNFEFIFENISTELPPATSLLLNLRDFISGNLYLIISFFLFLYLGVLFLYKRFSFVFDRVYFFNIPVLSKLVKNYTYYRFFLSIYIIIKSKYRFQTALNHSKKLLKNSYVKKRTEKIISQINNGVTISKAFENSKLFDELTIQLLYTAEYSNNYEKVLKDIMRLYEKRFQQSAREFTSYAEPALLLFIAGIVLWIVLAVMVPVWDLSSTL